MRIPPDTNLDEGRVIEYLPKGSLILGADFDAELKVPCYEVQKADGKRTYIPASKLHSKYSRERRRCP